MQECKHEGRLKALFRSYPFAKQQLERMGAYVLVATQGNKRDLGRDTLIAVVCQGAWGKHMPACITLKEITKIADEILVEDQKAVVMFEKIQFNEVNFPSLPCRAGAPANVAAAHIAVVALPAAVAVAVAAPAPVTSVPAAPVPALAAVLTTPAPATIGAVPAAAAVPVVCPSFCQGAEDTVPIERRGYRD
jgi:hypothetical protein